MEDQAVPLPDGAFRRSFDEELQGAFGTLADCLGDEIGGEVRDAGASVIARVKEERQAAVEEAVAQAREDVQRRAATELQTAVTDATQRAAVALEAAVLEARRLGDEKLHAAVS